METVEPGVTPPVTEDKRAAAAAGGSMTEAIIAAVAVVLTVLGIIGIDPITLVSIAIMGLGAVFVLESASLMRPVRDILRGMGEDTRRREGLTIGGMGVQALLGILAIVLGFLTLVGLTFTLDIVALLVLGVAAILAAPTIGMINWSVARMHHATLTAATTGGARPITVATSSIRTIVGIAAIVLAILSLADIAPLLLTEIGVLVMGGLLLAESMTYGAEFRHLGPRRVRV